MPNPRTNLLLRSPAFDPRRIPGLQVDLDASRIAAANGDQVGTWVDSISGFSPTQPTGTKQPLLDLTGINGQPALQFDGVDDALAVGPIPLLASCPGGTIFIVSQNTSDTPNVTRTMGVINGANGFRLGINQHSFPAAYDSAGGRRLDTDTAVVSLINPGYSSAPRIHCLAADWQGARFTQYINGQVYYTNSSFQTAGLSDSSTSTLEISNSGFPASIKIARILIYGLALSGAEQRLVGIYLSRRYFIPLP